MAGWTNIGKLNIGKLALNQTAVADLDLTGGFQILLLTSAAAPSKTSTSITASSLTEVTGGTGYTSGGDASTQVDLSATDLVPGTALDDTDFTVQPSGADPSWTASGGSITGARYAILTDTATIVNDRIIYAYWDLSSDRTMTTGQTLTLDDPKIRWSE